MPMTGSLSPMSRRPLRIAVAILLLVPAALPLACLAQPVYAVFGEDIPLGGSAPGSDTVYLFLTGPNLPADGISLDRGTPVATGDASSFTQVEVQTDATWTYTWRTGSMGRVLDQGTYVVYIVQQPLARPDLDDSDYATQAVVFGGPVETVIVTVPETPVPLPPGTMQGGPPVTGMATPTTPNQSTPVSTPVSTPTTGNPATTPGRLPIPPLLPLAAAALAALAARYRR